MSTGSSKAGHKSLFCVHISLFHSDEGWVRCIFGLEGHVQVKFLLDPEQCMVMLKSIGCQKQNTGLCGHKTMCKGGEMDQIF